VEAPEVKGLSLGFAAVWATVRDWFRRILSKAGD
jgi:hypothetical protein